MSELDLDKGLIRQRDRTAFIILGLTLFTALALMFFLVDITHIENIQGEIIPRDARYAYATEDTLIERCFYSNGQEVPKGELVVTGRSMNDVELNFRAKENARVYFYDVCTPQNVLVRKGRRVFVEVFSPRVMVKAKIEKSSRFLIQPGGTAVVKLHFDPVVDVYSKVEKIDFDEVNNSFVLTIPLNDDANVPLYSAVDVKVFSEPVRLIDYIKHVIF